LATQSAFGLAIVLGAFLFGCGPSVDGVCKDLNDKCDVSSKQLCESEGKAIESQADSSHCSDQFDDYLHCIDDEGCSWRTACADKKAALKAMRDHVP
jgi:hypothetical protein